jgi:hypothetical protein
MVNYMKTRTWLLTCLALVLSSGCNWLHHRESAWEETGEKHHVVCDPCYGYQPSCWRPWSTACPPCTPPCTTVANGVTPSQVQGPTPMPANPAEVISVPAAAPTPPAATRAEQRPADAALPNWPGEAKPAGPTPFYDERAGTSDDGGMPTRGL